MTTFKEGLILKDRLEGRKTWKFKVNKILPSDINKDFVRVFVSSLKTEMSYVFNVPKSLHVEDAGYKIFVPKQRKSRAKKSK